MPKALKLRIIGLIGRVLGVPLVVHQSFFTNGSKE